MGTLLGDLLVELADDSLTSLQRQAARANAVGTYVEATCVVEDVQPLSGGFVLAATVSGVPVRSVFGPALKDTLLALPRGATMMIRGTVREVSDRMVVIDAEFISPANR